MALAHASTLQLVALSESAGWMGLRSFCRHLSLDSTRSNSPGAVLNRYTCVPFEQPSDGDLAHYGIDMDDPLMRADEMDKEILVVAPRGRRAALAEPHRPSPFHLLPDGILYWDWNERKRQHNCITLCHEDDVDAGWYEHNGEVENDQYIDVHEYTFNFVQPPPGLRAPASPFTDRAWLGLRQWMM
ncbi:hypothetical protein BJX61DRAFT_538800 [Aspergillus egyptiacus]|nr:hypothetical protein BJX61DRAFT_538800 [Aspergillus egyptiacus]